jgi:hypothetical protein
MWSFITYSLHQIKAVSSIRHLTLKGNIKCKTNLVERPTRKRPLGGCKGRWWDNIKIYLKQCVSLCVCALDSYGSG